MAPKGRIVIDTERCKGCELCASVCPHNSIHMSDAFNSKGYHPAQWDDPNAACTGCATCAVICPDTAIRVYRETTARVVPVAA
jgi:2-oxoglutarate ferredoxin oxidoreductase subunit delta